MSALLVKHPEWLAQSLDAASLRFPRREQGLRREVHGWLAPALAARDDAGALARLRDFKQREMMRIAARDLARLGDVTPITRELANVADVCLDAVLQVCRRQLGERLGQPYHLDANERWQPTAVAVVALGKLGGQELNYSSERRMWMLFFSTKRRDVFSKNRRARTRPLDARSRATSFSADWPRRSSRR